VLSLGNVLLSRNDSERTNRPTSTYHAFVGPGRTGCGRRRPVPVAVRIGVQLGGDRRRLEVVPQERRGPLQDAEKRKDLHHGEAYRRNASMCCRNESSTSLVFGLEQTSPLFLNIDITPR
jgi:hypothetical protein